MNRPDDSDPLDQEIDFSQAHRGPAITPERDKTRVTISLDIAVVDWFREQVPESGGSYQTLINEALKVHINQQQSRNDLEQTLRRVLREELDARQAA